MRILVRVLGALGAALALAWILALNGLTMTRYFAPRVEQVRRETFEQSKAYTQGQIQELSNMQFQYEQASPEHQAALRSIILRRAADFDTTRLPPDLNRFIQSLRSAR